jgi:uncharacterized protein with beta-barrel porin domain
MGILYSTSLAGLIVSQIPTSSLSGNNLIFANYINQYAPQDIFYFIPAIIDGTLSSALESAAPTRNAVSLFMAERNLFYFTTSLSNQLNNRRLFGEKPSAASALSHSQMRGETGQLLASEQLMMTEKASSSPYTIWIEGIGALASQKAQDQTAGFDPASAGVISAFDAQVGDTRRFGGGAAYLYTHIDEDGNAGHSTINQEEAFIYATFVIKRVYAQFMLMGGLFQIDQVRNIQMSGFQFTSSSKPTGWQLLPHAEVGLSFENTEKERTKLVFSLYNAELGRGGGRTELPAVL